MGKEIDEIKNELQRVVFWGEFGLESDAAIVNDTLIEVVTIIEKLTDKVAELEKRLEEHQTRQHKRHPFKKYNRHPFC